MDFYFITCNYAMLTALAWYKWESALIDGIQLVDINQNSGLGKV